MHEQVDRFLNYLRTEKGYSGNTIAAYRNDLSQFVAFIGDELSGEVISWPEVDERLVRAYGQHLEQRIEQGQYTVSTVARKIASVKSFFSYLRETGVVAHNPTPVLIAPKVEKQLPRILTVEEVELLLAEPAKGTGPKALRDRALLELLYASGMRVSEMIGLQMDELALEQSRILLHSRDDKSRWVPLTPRAVESLTAYIERGRDALLKGRSEYKVFVNQRGRPLTRQGLWLIIKSYARSAGIGPGFTPHTLRHSCAAHRLAQGTDLQQVRELLGHANVSTTQMYQAMVEQAQDQADADTHQPVK